ncbi:hypothetical protein Tco_0291244 [Tanacetum coccineum]
MTDVDVNAPAELAPTMAPPTRTDDQILPHIRWVPIGKSNCYLDVDRPQSNPIFKIAVDLLKHTNFFRAFTASSAIPAIYIQQFWDTIRYDKIAGGYKCQLDEQWFDLSKDTLRDALQITPVDRNNAFSSPPTPDALIKFVNDLGYPKVVRHLSDVVTNDMFQPWRALTTIINLCLTGKTSGFERPRAPVLQILWGVINRAHIDYAERMWEEFTQSIHTFIEDKKNLAQHTQGKKKATLIVIPSIRFTKLIIHYLQSKHKFHTRPGSPLHLPNEEPVLGYLKFSSKGTKREHQRYLAGEDVSDPDSLAPKPTKGAKPKTTKKPTSSQQTKPKTKPSTAKTTKSTPSQPPKPKPAPAKPQEKKRKRALDAAEAPSQAKRSKAGRVSKKRTLQLRDEFIDEGVPAIEPRIDDEEAIVQKVLEESMKDAYLAHRGPLPPVVFREPDSGKLQPLPEGQANGKEKVREEQVAQVLLNLQTPKKKNPAEHITGASDSAQDPPPPPPSSTTNRGDKSQNSAAPGSSKTTASTEYTAWTMTTSRLKPAASSVPEDVLMHKESDFEAQDMASDDEDSGSRHIPKASALASSFVPPLENSLLSQIGDIGVFIDWFCKKQGITELKPEHLEGPAYEVVKAFHPDVIHLQFQMEECHKLLTNQVDEGLLRYNVSRPLPLGGPPGQVTIQTECFFNKDLEYLRFGHKGDRLALSIIKMKAASYPDVGLEQMVPDQMWDEEEYMYDISASYGTKEDVKQAEKGSPLRFIALPNWFHEAQMITTNDAAKKCGGILIDSPQNEQEKVHTDKDVSEQVEHEVNEEVPESSGITFPTASSKESSKLPSIPIVEIVVPTVSTHVPTDSENIFTIDPFEPPSTPTVESTVPTVSTPVPTVIKSRGGIEDTHITYRYLILFHLRRRGWKFLWRDLTHATRLNEVEADLSNMETTIQVSLTPTLEIHKDHPKNQIIGPVDTLVLTRHKSKNVDEQSFLATIHQKTDPDLLQICLFLAFLSQEEPKKISEALKDSSWVEAMQEELLHFQIQNV